MKKIFLFLALSLLTFNVAVADDSDFDSDTLLDDFAAKSFDFGKIKNVTDEQFNKVVDELKSRKNSKAEKQKKKQIPKGEEYRNSNETEIITNTGVEDELPVVCLFQELDLGNGIILPLGHYQIKAEKKSDDSVVIQFLQSHYIMAEVPATETNDDFGEQAIMFGRLLPHNDDGIVKVIYGSLDLNAYTYLKFLN